MAFESVAIAPAKKSSSSAVTFKTLKRVSSTSAVQAPAVTSVRVPSSNFTYRAFIGGAVGGMAAAFVTSPLEVVKTRLQICSGSGVFGSQTTFGMMRYIGKTESVYGLWRGIMPTLCGVIPARAIYFGSYSTLKEHFTSQGLTGRTFNFLSATGAGSLSATLCCPIWVVKTRLQLLPVHAVTGAMNRQNVLSVGFAELNSRPATTSRPQCLNFCQVAVNMYRNEGPKSFFRGLSASYWGISESAIQFVLYEECKNHIEEPSNLKLFLAAGACKLFASVCTYPHEVVRTRLRDQRAPMDSKELKYKSMIQSIIKIYKEEGRRGLYLGMPAHLMRVAPNAAILFMVVEAIANKK